MKLSLVTKPRKLGNGITSFYQEYLKENNTLPNRSVYVIGAPYRDCFLRADPPDQHTKTSWCFIGPALRLKPPGKNHCAVRPGPAPAGHSLLVSRFLPTRELINTVQPRNAPRVQKRAPPRCCANMHIPPNVTSNFGKTSKKDCFLIWKLLSLHKIENCD